MASALADINALIMDVDGVLTDGLVALGEDGIERRSYHVHDGIGLQLGRRCGLRFGVISSSSSPGIKTRAARLGIDLVGIGIADKERELRLQAQALQLPLAQIAFAGDDLVDLPAMALAGLAVAPANAVAAVKAAADLVTARRGGGGAVREICETLCAARTPDLLAQYRQCGLRL